jgi:hypothetical protein
MARWPSMHARLKGMKPHLPPKREDNRPTLGNEQQLPIFFLFSYFDIFFL